MNAPLAILTEPGELRRTVDRAASALADAATAADVLDAKDLADFAYDAAKAAARIVKAKEAHDDLLATMYRVEADALEVVMLAKRRLADAYDAAQESGELAGHGGGRGNQYQVSDKVKPCLSDVGLTPKMIFEARKIREFVAGEPLKIRAVLDDIINEGIEPTKARLNERIGILKRPKSRSADASFNLISGRDIRRLRVFELASLRRQLTAEIELIEKIAEHLGAADALSLVGDGISDEKLKAFRRAADEEIDE